MKDCIFCNPTNVIINGQYVYSRYDGFPVSKGHCLIIPKRHVQSIFDLTDEELKDLYTILKQTYDYLVGSGYMMDGYNVGINCGRAAGQTVEHLHIHLIPRYKGDVFDPTGGVRGVIPSKQSYKLYAGDEDWEPDPFGIEKRDS